MRTRAAARHRNDLRRSPAIARAQRTIVCSNTPCRFRSAHVLRNAAARTGGVTIRCALMIDCGCSGHHSPKRIVITGGPGAGKTAVLEMMRHSLCKHVRVIPDAAALLFEAGFPRNGTREALGATQRAIYFVQRELEALAEDENLCLILCNRGTPDAGVYWPGPRTLWEAVETKHGGEVERYDGVIHLRARPGEATIDARAIDERIRIAWMRHQRRFEVGPMNDVFAKAARTIEILRAELPPCCQQSVPIRTSFFERVD